MPDGWEAALPVFPADAKGMATRDASGKVLNAIAQRIPWLVGGAADLSPSTKTHMGFPGAGDFQPGARTTAATCIMASANMPCAPWSMA